MRIPGLPDAGGLISTALAAAALVVLLVVLVLLWRQYQPLTDARRTAAPGPGAAARIEDLPEGLQSEHDDPWSEALRCRARGDYARAVVHLFAHQLLTLDRLRQVRLVPGRTARQLVGAVGDAQLRSWVDRTLRLFEAVYYGRRVPTAEAFESVWAAAEAFERHVAGGAMLLLGALLLGTSGCAPLAPDATYGRSRGASVNGTGVLAALLRDAGHEVRTAIRLTPELDDWADVVVRFAPRPGPPERDEAAWYSDWLNRDRVRALVYVPRDHDARADYWGAVLEQLPKDAPADQRTRARTLRDEAERWPRVLPPCAENVATPEDWFAVVVPAQPSAVACKVLDGPWGRSIDAGRAALPRHQTLKVESERVLLTGDGLPLAIDWTRFNDSRVLVVASGAFLLNGAVVNPARRPLAVRVVDWVGDAPRKVAFVEGGGVLGAEPGMRSVFALLGVPPFGWVAAQMFALGLAGCLARAPRLGRPRPDPPTGADRPAAHVEAIGALLGGTRDRAAARAALAAYRQRRGTGPAHGSGVSSPGRPPERRPLSAGHA
jgi:hypothetical protein